MFWAWITKRRHQNSLRANGLIHDAIVMGIADKYIEKEQLQGDDFGNQLLGRALNWAVPNLYYNFENDLSKVENTEFRDRLLQDSHQIYKKGLSIVNADRALEQLITYYVTYELHLINALRPKDGEGKFPGIKRMKSLHVQSYENEPDVNAADFKETYKKLFIDFNEKYGQYGKVLKKESIDILFDQIRT